MSYLAAPILAARGLRHRFSGVKPPIATGPTHGVVHPQTARAGLAPRDPAASDHGPLRLGVVGDSTVEGVGSLTHTDGFPGQFAVHLAERTGRSVQWSSAGRSGATARRVRHEVLPLLPGEFDIVAVLVGVNDVVRNRSVAAWSADLSGVISDLLDRTDQIVFSGIPPMLTVPAFSPRIARDLERHARRLDRAAAEACAGRATWVDMAHLTPGPDQYASDRYHPSPIGYREWARFLADQVEVGRG